MSFTNYVFHEEIPDMSAIQTGSSATPPQIQSVISGAGSHALSTIAVKPGKDITLEIWSSGGGGGGGVMATAAPGGGPGTYWAGTIPAAVWALGGTLVLGAVGAAGATHAAGGDGTPSTLTIDSLLRLSVGGGTGGGADGGAPGVAGTTTVDSSITTLAIRPGPDAGAVPVGGHGGDGAKGGGPGGGAGGAGGTSGAGSAGAAKGGGGGGGANGGATTGGLGGTPYARISFSI